MFKRFFAVLASILVLLVPFIVKEFDFVEANSANPASDFEWSIINGNEVEIDKYVGSSKDVVIPNEIDGKEVTKIGINAFVSYNLELESVDIPDSVTEIGTSAFVNNNLKSVVIPRSEEHTSELQSRGHLVCRL